MIHIIACHFGNHELIKLQINNIKKYITEDHKIWLSYATPTSQDIEFLNKHNDGAAWFSDYIIDNNIENENQIADMCYHYENIPILQCPELNLFDIHPFHKGCRYIGSQNHQNNLHVLTERVLTCSETKDTDIIIWMDGDTFFLDSIHDIIDQSKNKFSAINRREILLTKNRLNEAPHPSFACCTVSFFKKNNLSWFGSNKYTPFDREHPEHNVYPDTGGLIYSCLKHKNIDWLKLYKTGNLYETKDPDLFSIYSDNILHVGKISVMHARPAFFSKYNSDDYKKLYEKFLIDIS